MLLLVPVDCIFCSIVRGEEPSHRVYEDEEVVAIMDVHPATAGHTLVILKAHRGNVWEIREKEAVDAMSAALRVAGMIRAALSPDGINLVHASGTAAWQTVPHFHLHLVPRYEGDPLVPPWPLEQARADESALQNVAERIRAHLTVEEVTTPVVSGVHHIQLAMPPGEEEAARRFYGDALDLREIPKYMTS